MKREEAIERLTFLQDNACNYYFSDEDEDALTMAIEALEQPEQKKGKWICHDSREGFLIAKYTCSICDYYIGTQKLNYCPNCGAKMEV